MKIFVVSWYMPPFNTMGALRVGKFCKYLEQQGHDVRVLSCSNLPFDRALRLEFPEDRIVRVPYVDVNDLPRAVQRLRVKLTGGARPKSSRPGPTAPGPAAVPSAASDRPSLAARVLRRCREIYQELLCMPDSQILWLWPAVRCGRRMIRSWRPDIVFASAPPFTTLMIGRRLARIAGVPWVAEYRDRFSEDPYAPPSGRRTAFQRWFEDRFITRGLSGIVTVSDPWAEDYRARYHVPVEVVYNGFDPDDFPVDLPAGQSGTADRDVLNIVYTGILYPDRRDPSPLFAAIRRMGDEGKRIRVAFYGADRSVLERMAAREGVTAQVSINDRVSYAEAIDLQRRADILLLLQWNDPKEQGNVPGKTFEYLGARRPVLGLGLEDGVPARILAERGAGVVVNDPDEIARHLTGWLDEKRAKGGIPPLPVSVRTGLSRAEQFEKLERFLKGFATAAGDASPAGPARSDRILLPQRRDP